MAAPDIDKSSSVPLDRTVCIADKELAGREGAGRRRRSAHLRGQWETETGDRTSGLINSNRSEVMSRRRLSGWRKEVSHIRRNLPVPATLADSGIDKKLSARAQKLAAMGAKRGSLKEPPIERPTLADAGNRLPRLAQPEPTTMAAPEGHSAPLAAFSPLAGAYPCPPTAKRAS